MLSISSTYSCAAGYAAVKEFFNSLCKETQSPVALHLLKSNDLEISRFRIRPEDYTSAALFRNDYLLSSVLSKWKGLKTDVDTKQVALSAFEKQEVTCASINHRLRQCRSSLVDPIIHRAQRVVANVLGPFDLAKMRGLERWGPGASTDLRRSAAYLDTKMTKLPIPVTREARQYLKPVIEQDLHWSYSVLGLMPDGPYSLLPHNFIVVEGSFITTVPKSAKTDRTIAIEPRGNMFLQKGFGNYLRRKLRKNGIDLDDQSLNQRLASVAHTSSLSTIDLSMASDSISEQLVFELLPIDWALYLNEIRSKSYSVDGVNYTRFQKFSSMGNGFTFELESLIFYAITIACRSDDSSAIAVYGDDIICHRDDAHVLICALSYLGFETNLDKTYVEGRFFESCGRHYFDGIDVTPFYQKEVVDNYSEHVRLVNRLARYLARQAETDEDSFRTTPGYKTWCRVLRGNIGRGTPTLPLGCEGDDGYLVTAAIFTPKAQKKSYGYQWSVSIRGKVTIPGDDPALLAYSLRQNSGRRADVLSHLSSEQASSACDLESRSAIGGLRLTTRWIDPSWEFYL